MIYSDPAGRNFLSNSTAQAVFQMTQDDVHRAGARVPRSAFTLPEAFAGLAETDFDSLRNVFWPAYPVSVGQSDTAIDTNRLMFQDEYVEWSVDRNGDGDLVFTFTTEFPEYFEAFAHDGFDAVRAAIREIYPDAEPTVEELFGLGFQPDLNTGAARADQFRRLLPSNPWNNGDKGILCLTHPLNTLGALVNLLTFCSIPRPDLDLSQVCQAVGNFCGEGRNSDPRISTAVQGGARRGLVLTAADPIGITMSELTGTWRRNGTVIDITTEEETPGGPKFWTVSRNRHRATLRIPAAANLTLDNAPITHGAQAARVLIVKSSVIAAHSDRVPPWARAGNEASIPPSVVAGV